MENQKCNERQLISEELLLNKGNPTVARLPVKQHEIEAESQSFSLAQNCVLTSDLNACSSKNISVHFTTETVLEEGTAKAPVYSHVSVALRQTHHHYSNRH